MLLTSVVRFFSASKLALALLAGAVGMAAGGGLAVATVNLASSTTHQTTADATHGNQAQAKGHGAEVTAAVAKCKAALPTGQHGIGKCVSAVANKHGKAASAAASANGNKTTTPDADESAPASKP
ncbi:MAG TPA: hypothetical protein VGF78_01145 [Candidatus Dormibacteraeota bacterium]|jgi:hypothetical protein